MHGNRRWFLRAAIASAIALSSGCATTESREFARELNPLVGRADQTYFIEKYGEPDKRSSPTPGTDIWEYTFGRQNMANHGAHVNLTTSTLVRLTFKNGTLSAWQATNRMY